MKMLISDLVEYSRIDKLGKKFERQANALVWLFDLQQVAGPFDEAVVVSAFLPKRLVRRPGRGTALHVRIGADQLDRSAELARARPEIERERLGIYRRLVFRRADQDKSIAIGAFAQDRAGHQRVNAGNPVSRGA